MPDRFTAEEFSALLEHWAPEERAIYEQRMADSFARDTLTNFSPVETALLRAVLARLIPEAEGVDLAGFIDAYADKPLGRGDRGPGMPDEPELFRLGLLGIDQSSQLVFAAPFRELSAGQQDSILRSVSAGSAEGAVWKQLPPSYFFARFYGKALHGYFAHPRVWMRIGFMGSAYPEGYVWMNKGEVRQRHARAIGWDTL